MKNALIIAAVTLLGIAGTPARANTIVFSWVTAGNSNTNLGLSYSQTVSGLTLTAYGLTEGASLTTPATAGPGLFAKNGGVGETGLGMSTDPAGNNEINAAVKDGIQIDFSNALAAQPNGTVTMTVGSAQANEGWALYGSNTLLTIAGNSKTQGALG